MNHLLLATQESCSQAGLNCLGDTIKREAILLYEVEFSNGNRVSVDSKRHICKALEPHEAAKSSPPLPGGQCTGGIVSESCASVESLVAA
eukprot:4414483-Pleurochrysis_carterae.AAC.1